MMFPVWLASWPADTQCLAVGNVGILCDSIQLSIMKSGGESRELVERNTI